MGAGNGYAVGQTGGVTAVTFTEAQLPSHAHVVDPPNTGTTANGDHAHIVDPPNTVTTSNGHHAHTVPARDAMNTSVLTINDNGGDSIVSSDNSYAANSIARNYSTHGGGDLAHTVNIGAFWSDTRGSHAHTMDIAPFWSNATGGSQAHENLPPYRASLFCIYLGGGDGAVAKSFNDLEDVDTSGSQDNDILVWNESSGQWRPEGQWVKDGTKLYYDAGMIGIGTSSPKTKLHIVGLNSTPIGTFAEGVTAENPVAGTGGTRSILRTDGGLALIRANDATSGNTNGYIDFSAAPDLYPQGRYGRMLWDDANSAFRSTARDADGTSPAPYTVSCYH